MDRALIDRGCGFMERFRILRKIHIAELFITLFLNQTRILISASTISCLSILALAGLETLDFPNSCEAVVSLPHKCHVELV
jgi:hypothetical protein